MNLPRVFFYIYRLLPDTAISVPFDTLLRKKEKLVIDLKSQIAPFLMKL